MTIVSNLNKDQLAAVEYEGDKLLVLAGAGSGKTKVLIQRACWFIQKKSVSPHQILLLTFTNKAAREMQNRMSKLMPNDYSLTPAFFAGTFHSFCVRLLRIDGQEIGINPNFVIYDDT